MHDPMVVAFDIRRPWPTRSYTSDKDRERRWHWQRHGKWWKPGSWSPFVTVRGQRWYFPSLVTIWHVEPNGRDSGEVCNHWRTDRAGRRRRDDRWKWHVWHWKIQVATGQKIKRFLFERCIECGRRYPWGYAPVSHQWDGPGGRWFRVGRLNYHHECSALVHQRRQRESDETLIRHLFAAYRLGADLSEPEALAQLTDPRRRSLDFHESYRLTRMLGYERDSNYDLVPVAASLSGDSATKPERPTK